MQVFQKGKGRKTTAAAASAECVPELGNGFSSSATKRRFGSPESHPLEHQELLSGRPLLARGLWWPWPSPTHSLTSCCFLYSISLDSSVRWPWNPSRISCGRSVVLRSIPCASNSTTPPDPKSLTSTTLRGHSASTLLRMGQSLCP